jgi:2',3'-cyclic-nucleotide 2'-phosphodiesterase
MLVCSRMARPEIKKMGAVLATGYRLRSTGGMWKILFIGDIVGRPGRAIVSDCVATLRQELAADLVIANGENAASGAGLSGSIARELLKSGIDGLTLGDHCWDCKGFDTELPQLDRVCRPANLPAACPGLRSLVLPMPFGRSLGVFTVLGRTFMKLQADDPFTCARDLLATLRAQCNAVIVEVHAEATSEKIALGWYLDGLAAAVLGTHTHVPTADCRVLPRGTAYMTDVGMTGPYESVLGRAIQPVLGRFLDGMPRKFEVAEGDVRLCGALVTINPVTGLAMAIERVEHSMPA